MLWVKATHIIFVISWMAGLFYLPRLFVNAAQVEDVATQQRLQLMMGKLYRFTTGLGILALGLGLWLWQGWWAHAGAWMHAKLLLVLGLVVFHLWCGRVVRCFAQGNNQRNHIWYRYFNEIPTLLMFAIVVLVVVKPF